VSIASYISAKLTKMKPRPSRQYTCRTPQGVSMTASCVSMTRAQKTKDQKGNLLTAWREPRTRKRVPPGMVAFEQKGNEKEVDCLKSYHPCGFVTSFFVFVFGVLFDCPYNHPCVFASSPSLLPPASPPPFHLHTKTERWTEFRPTACL